MQIQCLYQYNTWDLLYPKQKKIQFLLGTSLVLALVIPFVQPIIILFVDVVDEDDFLYGGVGEEKTRRQSVEDKPDTESSAPKSAQEIVSNPAFTALLKKIGLDDLKLAERIKVSVGQLLALCCTLALCRLACILCYT